MKGNSFFKKHATEKEFHENVYKRLKIGDDKKDET